MPTAQKLPKLQCNSAKTITVLKELFAEYGIPEEIQSDNGPQFIKDWSIKHSTSSPRNPRHNKQAEPAVKIVRGPTHPCQVLWTGSISCFVSIHEDTS